jgi:hypothetical protein
MMTSSMQKVSVSLEAPNWSKGVLRIWSRSSDRCVLVAAKRVCSRSFCSLSAFAVNYNLSIVLFA